MTNALPAYQAAGQIVEAAESHQGLDLEPIVRMLDGSYALMFRMGVADDHVEDAASHGVDVGYVSRLREAGRERMLPGWLSQIEPGSVIDRSLFGSDQQFARTPFYNHVIRPEGSFHCMIATPLSSQTHRSHLVIGRPRHRPGFDAGDMRLFRGMLPLVNEVIHTRAELAHSEATARSAFGISEAWPYPLLVANAKGIVHHANQRARELLATGDALVIDTAARLRSNIPSNDHKLWQSITAALRTGKQQRVTLQTSMSARGLYLNVRRVDPVSVGDMGHPSGWVLITAEDHQRGITDASLAAVGRQYGLTGRETALLSCLVQGTHLKEACRQLGISYNTGRCHLRQIFGKTETHRQSELVRVCVTGRNPNSE